jgi:protease IV
MRRLLIIFLVLAALGAALAALGVVLARGHLKPHLLGGAQVVTLRLAGEIPDYRPAPPLPWLSYGPESHLAGLWRTLDALRRDPAVRALAVRIDDVGTGLAKAQELRRQLAETVSAGKTVVCHFDTAGEGSNGTLEYYLASACSSISLAPVGELNLLGLYSDPLFLRGTLDKLKIEPDFLAAGRYKSFAETFTESAHSPAAREALEAVLDGYWRQIVADLAAARGLGGDRVRELVDRAPLAAAQALATGLVDHLEYADEVRARLDEELGGKPQWVEFGEYARRRVASPSRRAAVAVVFAQGAIVRGNGGAEPWTGEPLIGAEGLGELLSELAEDDGVAAVVLRLDSGGGSAVASDLLHRRVELLRRAKPVVVSMSDLAASGAYYLAAGASRIVAEPASLTGSIGVVSGKLATGRFERELLGATRDPLARGARAGIYSSALPFDDDAREALGARLGDVYDRFLAVVAAGRGLPRPAVERLAQGRVWVGEDAERLGLIDSLGGLDAALAAARELAGLPAGEGAVRFYPRSRGLWEWLAASGGPHFGADAAAWRDLAAWRRDVRVPGALELPRALRAVARPF